MASTTNRTATDMLGALSAGSKIEPNADSASQIIEVSAPIPLPRRQAMNVMRALTTALGGGAIQLRLTGTSGTIGFRFPSDGLTILGTGCRRPLLCEEAQDLRKSLGDHVLIVRTEDATHDYGEFTVDLLLAHMDSWLVRYRLWQIHPTSDLWLVPTQGEGRSVRFVAGYLAVSPRAPFFNLYEREQGFAIAAKALTTLGGEK